MSLQRLQFLSGLVILLCGSAMFKFGPVSAGIGSERPANEYKDLFGTLAELPRVKREPYKEAEFLIHWPLLADPDRPKQVLVANDPRPGLLIHRSEILVQLKPNTPVATIPQHLEAWKARYRTHLVGVIP